MHAYYEIETHITDSHQLNLKLPDEIPVGKAKVAIIYELPLAVSVMEDKSITPGSALAAFLKQYQSEAIDVDTRIFDQDRGMAQDRDFSL